MLVISGFLGELGKYSDCIHRFNFLNNTWSILHKSDPKHEKVFRPRIGSDLVIVKDQIYVFGGYDGSERLNDLFCFDIK